MQMRCSCAYNDTGFMARVKRGANRPRDIAKDEQASSCEIWRGGTWVAWELLPFPAMDKAA